MAKKSSAKDMKSLRESLAESLKQAVPSADKGTATASAEAPPLTATVVSSTPVNPSAAFEEGELKRTTVTMKLTEQQRADEILTVLQKCRRHRGGLTEAISIALRICPLDPDLIGRAWDENRAADKRTHRKIKS